MKDWQSWAALVIFIGTYALIISEKVHRVAAALGGAGLGGNATAIGASANVVVLGIAERNRTPISFWHFTRYGLVVTAITVALAAVYVWLRYFALA